MVMLFTPIRPAAPHPNHGELLWASGWGYETGGGGTCRCWGSTSWSPAPPAWKGVLWSIIAGLAPGVRAGWTRLLVIDPKGGRGQKLFTGFAYDNGDNTLGVLRAVTTVMQQRAQRLRGHTRLHTPNRRTVDCADRR